MKTKKIKSRKNIKKKYVLIVRPNTYFTLKQAVKAAKSLTKKRNKTIHIFLEFMQIKGTK